MNLLQLSNLLRERMERGTTTYGERASAYETIGRAVVAQLIVHGDCGLTLKEFLEKTGAAGYS